MIRPSTVPDATERSPEVERALAWLQAEQNAAQSPAYSSMLLHESAVILEATGDAPGAERLYRGALALKPDFREPLEWLLDHAERHQTTTELTELYQRLADSSDDPLDRVRTLTNCALLELEQTDATDSAIAKLRQAAKLDPKSSIPWLLLDLIGHRTAEPKLREEALLNRLDLAVHPELRCLLLLDLARLGEQAEDFTTACARLDEAISTRTSHCYPALVYKTRLALRAALPSELDQALTARLRLLEETAADPGLSEALGVLDQERAPIVLAYLHLLRSFALQALGQADQASVEVGAARAELPEDVVVLLLNLAIAEQQGDVERFVSAGLAVAPLLEGDAAAWCWTQLAKRKISEHETPVARQFIEQGLARSPRSLPLHALKAAVAFRERDRTTLAGALRDAADCLESSRARTAWLLAAAAIWARYPHDGQATREAVTQALAQDGASESTFHVARLISLWSGDVAHYDDLTFRTLTFTQNRIDRLDLGLELLRTRLVQLRSDGIDAVLAELLRSDESAFLAQLTTVTLGNWLRRAALSNASSPEPPTSTLVEALPLNLPFEVESWEYLASRCESKSLVTALHCVAALSELNAGRKAEAEARLTQLAALDAANLVVAITRVTLSLREEDFRQGVRILRQTAEATPDPTLRSTLALYGVVLGINRAVEEQDLTALLDLAELTHPDCVAVLSRWLLRTVKPESPELRRRVQNAATALGLRSRRLLEQWGLCFAQASSSPLRTARLSTPNVDDCSVSTFSSSESALALLELLEEDRLRPLDECRSPEAFGLALSALGAAIRYAEVWFHGPPAVDAPQRLIDARAWAQVDPSLLAQLEWFLVARHQGNFTDEAQARDVLARTAEGKDGENLAIGLQQLYYLLGDAFPPLLPSTSAAARFANLEVSPPGTDPRRRATALAEAADLQGPNSTLVMRANLAFNYIAYGDFGKAQTTFSDLVETRPNFLPAWLGLRTVAELTRNPALLARACAGVGDLLTDSAQASAEWERAADLLFGELGDPERGRTALERATRRDITRDTSFKRLFRLVRDGHEHDRLLELIAARLPYAKDDEERILLFWERARTLRTQNDRPGALAALESVTQLDPNHVGALALGGEIHIALGHFDDAARYLAQLGRLESAPLKQRLMSALAAADLFDKKLGHPAFARDILLEFYRQGHAPLQLMERLAAAATKTESYPLAVEVLEALLDAREDDTGRLAAARLVMALCRDRLGRPERAELAVNRLLALSPVDSEALELVLSNCFPEATARPWLERAERQLRSALQRTPLEASLLETLARIAGWFQDVRTRQACLGALVALGCGTEEQDEEITRLDEQLEHVPTIAVNGEVLDAIAAPEDQGPLTTLFAQFATVFADAFGPSLAALGVSRKQRVEARAGLPLRNEIAAWAGAFGIAEFELYLAPQVDGDVIAIPGERPIVVASSALTAPLDLRARQAVARELFALRRGTAILRHRSVPELAALIVAVCQVGEHPISAPSYAMKDEFVRLFGAALPRRLRKSLSELSLAVQSSGIEPTDYIRAATHSLDRVAALAAGDVSVVLCHVTLQRGRLGTSRELRDRTARLIAFVTSNTYLELKDTLGLNVR